MNRTELGTAETNIKPKKRRLYALISLVIGLLFGLLLVEIALRVVGYSSPEFYAADVSRGYALIPGMKGDVQQRGTQLCCDKRRWLS
ncbi:MAG: hypothetical protein IPK98_07715 [Chloracidobacterium sp.]|nr:hypothetical protein [Chloracidobacterium sp.]